MENSENQLLVSSTISDGILIITAKGRFDHINVNNLKKLNGLVESEKKDVILDLIDVHYASSTFIHYLINLEDLIKSQGKRLAIVLVSEFLLKVLALTGVNKRYKIFSTIEDAKKYLL